MGKSKIPWTDCVWNPTIGCDPKGAGCVHCYAEKLHNQRHEAWKNGTPRWLNAPKQYHKPFSEIQLLEDRLDWPLHWRKPRNIFVDSMSDLFHPEVPFEFIDKVYDTIQKCPQHTFQILTKRIDRAWDFYAGESGAGLEAPPLPNVHILASASTQAELSAAEEYLWQIPAVVRGFCLEPLLGPIHELPPFEWYIIGYESGPNRRPCKIEWVQSMARQCRDANVPLFVKQLDIGGKVVTDPSRFPADFRIREYPK